MTKKIIVKKENKTTVQVKKQFFFEKLLRKTFTFSLNNRFFFNEINYSI